MIQSLLLLLIAITLPIALAVVVAVALAGDEAVNAIRQVVDALGHPVDRLPCLLLAFREAVNDAGEAVEVVGGLVGDLAKVDHVGFHAQQFVLHLFVSHGWRPLAPDFRMIV